MRLQHWLTSLLSVLAVLTASSNLHAQGVPGGFAPADPGLLNDLSGHGSNRPPIQDQYGGIPSSHQISTAPPGAAALPPTMNPYPAISPFENRFDETYNSGGLWFNDTNNEADKQFFTMSAFFARLNKPGNGYFGNPNGADRGIILIDPEDRIYTINYRSFDMTNFADNEHLKTEGMMLRWGQMMPDQTGIVADAFWASDYGVTTGLTSDTARDGLIPDEDREDLGLGTPSDYVIGVNNYPASDAVRFNRFVRMSYSATAAGTSLNYLNSPFVNLDYFKIRTLWGARYNFVREGMQIYGQDRLYFGSTDYEKEINSRTRSNLFGPEAGLMLEMGGKYLKFVSRTKVGVLGNFEETKLWGYNFGSIGEINSAGGNTTFASSKSNAHLSPSIEQNVHFETRLLHFVPYLNRIPYFDQAAFRFGYNYMVFGEMQRPGNAINYRSLPLFPTIQSERHNYRISGWDIGVTFDF